MILSQQKKGDYVLVWQLMQNHKDNQMISTHHISFYGWNYQMTQNIYVHQPIILGQTGSTDDQK